MMILVTGASGTTGGAVLRAARAAGLPVRAMVRGGEAATAGAEGVTVVADFADPPSLVAALRGISHVFVVCGPIPQLVALESNMIAACRTAGVRHVVLSSALGAGHYDRSFPSWHAQVEAVLRGSGLGWTILRPNGFMQNIGLYNGATIRGENAFYAALGEARVSLVDVADVGAAAAAVLADPSPHDGRIYELNGPEPLRNADVAARLSAVLGRTIAYVDVPEAAQRAAMAAAGMPEWQVTAILELQAYYRSGACAAGAETLAGLLGRPPRRLDDYLRDNAAVFGVNG